MIVRAMMILLNSFWSMCLTIFFPIKPAMMTTGASKTSSLRVCSLISPMPAESGSLITLTIKKNHA